MSEFLFGTRWTPRFAGQESYGVLPLITGTLWTTVIALLIAVPFGLGAAVYLAEYAPPRVRKVLKPVLEVLAGIPSVVYGFFALTFVAPVVLEGLLGIEVGTFSVLAAGLVLGIMIIPTVASLSEDAMSAVPDVAAAGIARARRQQDAHHAAGGLPGGDLRHRRLHRAGAVAGGRRDDDRRARRRHPGADGRPGRPSSARR